MMSDIDGLHIFESGMFTQCVFGLCLSEPAYFGYLHEIGADLDAYPFLPDGRLDGLKTQACMHTIPHDKCGVVSLIITIDVEEFCSSELALVAGLISHECTHVLQKLKLILNEDAVGDEIEAYFVQWMVQNCMKIIMEKCSG